MIIYHKISESIIIAELKDDNLLIADAQEILDLIGDLVSEDCTRIIIHDRNLHADFFRLKTGLAGEILQKFSNYRVKLAITGDFSRYESNSLRDFIRESNKGTTVFFADNTESALMRLTKTKNF
jgi:hypothetical protein